MNVRFMNLGMLVYQYLEINLLNKNFVSGHNFSFVGCNEHKVLFHFSSQDFL